MTIAEVLAVLLVKANVDIPGLYNQLVAKKVLVKENGFNSLLVTHHWDDVVTTILLNSEPIKKPENEIEALADALMQTFPQGKKDGTAQYWRGNRREISLRLKKFFKLYGNAYTTEEMVEAAKKYVEGFNGVYRYMRVLKYFIWKDERKLMEDGSTKVIEVSELANYLENANQEEDLKEDWTSTLK